MSSLIESEAHFIQRAREIKCTDDVLAELRVGGFTSLGQQAYAVGQPGQVIPESAFNAFCTTTTPGANAAGKACIRRLVFEAQTLVLADLRLQVSDPEGASRKMPEAERDRRLQHLRGRLPGVLIEGGMEPGRCVLEDCVRQESANQLKYLSPDRCVSRTHEVTHSRGASRQLELESSKLVIKETDDAMSMPTHSALQVQEALRRRGIAYVFAQCLSFNAYEKYISRLFSNLHREPPPGFARCSVAQLVEADRQVFVRLIELGVQPRAATDGSLPMDDALISALESYHVSMALMPLPQKQGNGNKERRELKRKLEPGDKKIKGGPKGGGKGKGKYSLTARVPKEILQKGGVANAPTGEPLCFDYNLHGDKCKCSAATCPRKHLCCKCFQPHPIRDHKE